VKSVSSTLEPSKGTTFASLIVIGQQIISGVGEWRIYPGPPFIVVGEMPRRSLPVKRLKI
jgi:hypothetical protein